MGGQAPLGYKVENGRLVTVEPEAQQVGHIFERFLQIGSATALVKELNAAGLRTKRGKSFDKSVLYKLLCNRTYVGEVEHKGTAHPGAHAAIIDCETPPRRGAHYKVSHPTQDEILTIPVNRPIKPVYIRKLVAFVDSVLSSQE